MKVLLYWLLAFLFATSNSPTWAQALPQASPDRVNRTVSGVMQQGLKSRGFAANDPRFGNTLAKITPSVASIAGTSAAAITVGTVTAPAWATVALAAGIGAVVTYSVSLGLDALVSWLFGDNSISDTVEGTPLDSSQGIQQGGAAWRTSDYVTYLYGGDPAAIGNQARYNIFKRGGGTGTYSPVTCETVSTVQVKCGSIIVALISSGAPGTCPAGSFWISGGCSLYGFAQTSSSHTNATPQDAIARIPASDLDKPLNPAIIAALANRVWEQAAAQPGYAGLPYSHATPITQAEVQAWQQANPQYTPTVRDFVSPNPSTSTSPNPWSLPSDLADPKLTPVTSNTGTTNPASESPQQNLGPDPGIGAPTLEQPPTAQQIAQPVLDLLPEFRNFHATAHTGSCPRPTIELYGTHVLEAHCTLIEDNKAVIQAAMTFAWAALALFIILSA